LASHRAQAINEKEGSLETEERLDVGNRGSCWRSLTVEDVGERVEARRAVREKERASHTGQEGEEGE